jgi:iron complex transport system permease protein
LARRTLVLAALLAALALATVASLALGAVEVPISEVIDVLLGRGGGGPEEQIVETLRLPRTVEALTVGAALGVAGAVLQGALANPLASPDVIGVTGGAGIGGILIIVLFPGSIALLPVGALFFGLLAATLVFVFAWSGRNRGSVGKVILAGIAMLSLFTAATTGLLAAASAAIAGLLGFLGLVVPHVVRMAGGSSSHTYVVPASALGGAALLAAGDTLARTLRAPVEMPVGPFMVVLGVPLFLWLLRKAV